MAGQDSKIYDTRELAEFFGVTEKTVRKWCQSSKLPAFKIGKDWKVRRSDLNRLINQKVESAEEKHKRLL